MVRSMWGCLEAMYMFKVCVLLARDTAVLITAVPVVAVLSLIELRKKGHAVHTNYFNILHTRPSFLRDNQGGCCAS
eukprot:1158711-Pelagomonas_calceolata.AAC.5